MEDVGNALDAITGRTLGTRVDQWKRFWERNAARFEIPTDAELAKLAEAAAKNKARYVTPGSTSFGGIDTPSRSILFVIDVSGSMENLVVDRERFEAGDYPSWSRMDIVKTELARTVEGLEGYVKFGIVAFATDTKRWKKKLVPSERHQQEERSRLHQEAGATRRQQQDRAAASGARRLREPRRGQDQHLGRPQPRARHRREGQEQPRGVPQRGGRASSSSPTAALRTASTSTPRTSSTGSSRRTGCARWCCTRSIGDFSKAFMEQLAGRNGGVRRNPRGACRASWARAYQTLYAALESSPRMRTAPRPGGRCGLPRGKAAPRRDSPGRAA